MKIGTREPLPFIARTTSGNWKSGSPIECIQVIDENEDVRSYRFKDPSGAGFNFKAGQHISILLPLDDGDDYRTFTICSSPTRPDEITLTVKTNRPDGATAWMRKNIVVGSTLTAVGPTGQFNIADNPCEKLLLISAGSGITPMMSMIRWLSDRKDDLDITFIHYAKNSDEYLFSSELKEIAELYTSLKYYQISTHREEGEIHGLPNIEQISGVVNISDHELFCCGPSGFMEVIKTIALEAGLNSDHYHQESFGNSKIVPSDLPVIEGSGTATIHYKGRSFEAEYGSNLLTALKQNKFVIPTGCRSGMCGTCQMKLEHGTVDMNQQGGLNDKQIEYGYILACCSTITGDLTVS